MKKIICIALTFFLCFSAVSFSVSAAENSGVQVNAKAYVLMDVTTGKVLLSGNEHQKLYPASVTKIMPLLLFMEAIDSGKLNLDDVVTASPTASSKGGSQIWLKEGEKMTVDELLRATAIASANDACTALGEHLAGSEEAFVAMMNERAEKLGMKNTNFVNCSGLDDDTTEHLTTAYDIALMSAELLRHDRIKQYTTVWMDSLRDGATQLVNTNRLVRFYPGTTGLKTGTTEKAGHCLAASAERDGMHLVAVVMGAENSNDRFESAKNLLNKGFADYVSFVPEVDSGLLTEVEVIRGVQERIKPHVVSTKTVTLKKEDRQKLETQVELAKDVEAPVSKNQILGKMIFKVGDETVCEYKLVAKDAVEKIDIVYILHSFLKSLTKSA